MKGYPAHKTAEGYPPPPPFPLAKVSTPLAVVSRQARLLDGV